MILESINYQDGKAVAVLRDKEGYRLVIESPPNPNKEEALKLITEKVKTEYCVK